MRAPDRPEVLAQGECQRRAVLFELQPIRAASGATTLQDSMQFPGQVLRNPGGSGRPSRLKPC